MRDETVLKAVYKIIDAFLPKFVQAGLSVHARERLEIIIYGILDELLQLKGAIH